MDLLFDSKTWILIFAGVALSFWGGIVGGSGFLTLSVLQLLCPGISFGALVGNQKMGGVGRGIGGLFSLWNHVNWKLISKIVLVALPGTILGASFIAHLDQRWLIFVLIFAVFLAEVLPRFAEKISKYHFWSAIFLLGFYAGFLGVGLGIFLIALLRSQMPAKKNIFSIKIQVRVAFFALNFVAVFIHFLHGNLIAAIWIPLILGNFLGGYWSGHVMKKMQHFSGNLQNIILRATFLLALAVAAWRFF